MKNILGDILFVLGLTLFMACAYKDLNVWFWIISVVAITVGLELIIEGKLNKMKKKIIEEISNK